MHNFHANKLLSNLLACFLFLLFSCGKGFEEEEEREDETFQGIYKADLLPLNQKKIGKYHGRLSISIMDNQFWARIRFSGPELGGTHGQYIHANGRCPTMRDDTNRDGYLDFLEAYRVAGPMLLPLDSNLNTQIKGIHDFPRMKNHPHYYYSEACNFTRLMDDLRIKDMIFDDMITKLQPNEHFKLENRVVLIYGINEENKLPSSVRSYGLYTPQFVLPVACGHLTDGIHSLSEN